MSGRCQDKALVREACTQLQGIRLGIAILGWDTVSGLLKRLPYRERQIIMLRYCMSYKATLQDCGNIFDICRERVRQIEAKAVRMLGSIMGPMVYDKVKKDA